MSDRSDKSAINLPIRGRHVFAAAMIAVGVFHFVSPASFTRIMPAYLPAHLFLVYLSGFFEIAGGVGLLVARTRRLAAWGLIALFIAVFPANINMAVNHISFSETSQTPAWFLWARLGFQPVLIYWAWKLTRRRDKAPGDAVKQSP